MSQPWIKVVGHEESRGKLREIYDETLKKRGKLAEIHKVHSLNPESLAAHMGLYLTLLFGRSPLSRRERELVGVAVSRSNGCSYCVAHHSESLARYEKRADYVKALGEGSWEALEDKDLKLARYVEKLTVRPKEMRESDLKPLREAGYSDEAILDIVQIAAYFNFVNRMVLGLGVPLESRKEREGYKY